MKSCPGLSNAITFAFLHIIGIIKSIAQLLYKLSSHCKVVSPKFLICFFLKSSTPATLCIYLHTFIAVLSSSNKKIGEGSGPRCFPLELIAAVSTFRVSCIFFIIYLIGRYFSEALVCRFGPLLKFLSDFQILLLFVFVSRF